jgi:hypothetical protein
MGQYSVRDVIRLVKDVERPLRAEAQEKKASLETARDTLERNYRVVQDGVLDLVKTSDSSILSRLSAAARQVGKAADFSGFVEGVHGRNAEIDRELKSYQKQFGSIAARNPQDGAVPQDGRSYYAEVARIKEEMEPLARSVSMLEAILENRKQDVTYENAAAFLQSCRNPGVLDFLRPSVWIGRSINKAKDKGTSDALETIKQILERKHTLEELDHVEDLKREYKDEAGVNTVLRDKILDVFNSASHFTALAPMLGGGYERLSAAFTASAQAHIWCPSSHRL